MCTYRLTLWNPNNEFHFVVYEERAKSFKPEHIKLHFFTIYISVKRAFFTDSYESAADMASS